MIIDKATWGNGLWNFLHSSSYAAPTKRRSDSLGSFFENLGSMIPCPDCQKHYDDFYLTRGPPTNSNLSEWIVDLHNNVNKRIGKKTMTYKEARDYWVGGSGGGCGCPHNASVTSSKYFNVIFITLLLIVFLIFIVWARWRCNRVNVP